MRAVQNLRVDPPGAAVLGRTRPDAPRVLDPWEQQTFPTDPDFYQDKLAGTRMVIQAAPEPPKRMQLRMYRGQ
jgi:hypothetical protein